MTVEVIPLRGLPEVGPGDDLAALLVAALKENRVDPRDGDVVVVTQKVVSKAEGRMVPEEPEGKAAWVARETRRVVARRGDLVIAETRHGFVCANAGVDASNVSEGFLTLLPEDPDASADRLRQALVAATGARVAVVVTDTFGRAWRRGLVNVAIGAAGLPALVDLRGTKDATGRLLEATVVALADEVAAASGLVMGKADAIPVAVVRGVVFDAVPQPAGALVRPPEEDLFRRSPLQLLKSQAHAGAPGPGPVSEESVAEAIEVAAQAIPTGDRDGWRVTLVEDPLARRRVLEAVRRSEAVPDDGFLVLVPCLREAATEQQDGWVRAGAALQTLLLALMAQELAVQWFPPDEPGTGRLTSALPIEEGWSPLAVVVVGAPAESRRERRSVMANEPARAATSGNRPGRGGEELVPPEAVREVVLAAIRPLDSRPVPLLEAAGLVLADPIVAPFDLPPFANAAMDGYALRAADTASAPVSLEVVGRSFAGQPFEGTVGAGQAALIATGAAVPTGADAVVRVEEAEADGARVLVRTSVEPGRDVREAGGDVRAGRVVVERGTVFGPGQAAAAAALGFTSVFAHPRVRVAIVPTGDEVREPGRSLGPAQVHDAVSAPLAMLVREAGGDPRPLAVVPDDLDRLVSVLEEAAAHSDALMTVGGISMGERDVVRRFEGWGALRSFRVALRPAKPFAFGEVRGLPLFGLPGNPGSALASFEELVRPALLAMMGRPAEVRPGLQAVLAERFRQRAGRLHLARAEVWREGGRLMARAAGEQGAGAIHSLARANAWMVVPPDVTELPPGSAVTVRPFGPPP